MFWFGTNINIEMMDVCERAREIERQKKAEPLLT